MSIDLKVPAVGESISEGVIAEWLKAEGDTVEIDEPLVVIETDKVNVELPAPASGRLTEILEKAGATVTVDQVVGRMEEGSGGGASKSDPAEARDQGAGSTAKEAAGAEESGSPQAKPGAATEASDEKASEDRDQPPVMPAARRILEQQDIDAGTVEGSGKGGRVLKEDAQQAASSKSRDAKEPASGKTEQAAPAASGTSEAQARPASPSVEMPSVGSREERAVRMTPLRKRVAERLVEAQQTAALLTTFNEVDMSAVMALRKRHQDAFVAAHGIKLGFMSFFVKAVIEALGDVPELNAEIRGDEIVYRNYYDIGIAVGGGKGLVVPIVRNAERLSFAATEKAIAALAEKAKKSTLTLEELQGGTFTITNGGIYGSLLSTPIVNPPQSGILGMHKIEERPIAVDGQVVVRPMMYVAVTYDHRLVDGREAVTFLVKVKERLEDPTRILLEI